MKQWRVSSITCPHGATTCYHQHHPNISTSAWNSSVFFYGVSGALMASSCGFFDGKGKSFCQAVAGRFSQFYVHDYCG